MKIQIRTFFAAIAIALLLNVTAPANAKQGGVLLGEVENTRMDVWKVHNAVTKNFTYELDEDGKDTWQVYDGAFKFVGDCEDFAFTMQRIVGAGSVFMAVLPTGNVEEDAEGRPNHAVFVYAGIVWELDGSSLRIERYEQGGRKIFFRAGDITPELR